MSQLIYFKLIKSAKKIINQYHLDPNVAIYLLQRRLQWNNTQLLMNYRSLVPDEVKRQYYSDLHQYCQGRPPQYIIGTAPFYGYNFKVNSHVLIPRQETEGLVDWVLKEHSAKKIKVIDIGTGSGAIAITLKLQRPDWDVTATDISVKALQVAKMNAKAHCVDINFKRCDLFKGLKRHAFNVIISNPPYVAPEEKKYMDKDVIQFEPHLALFAGNHGLSMYNRIANSFRKIIRPQGELYLEIGFRQGKAIKKIFRAHDSDLQLKIRKDLAGRPRMVKVFKS